MGANLPLFFIAADIPQPGGWQWGRTNAKYSHQLPLDSYNLHDPPFILPSAREGSPQPPLQTDNKSQQKSESKSVAHWHSSHGQQGGRESLHEDRRERRRIYFKPISISKATAGGK